MKVDREVTARSVIPPRMAGKNGRPFPGSSLLLSMACAAIAFATVCVASPQTGGAIEEVATDISVQKELELGAPIVGIASVTKDEVYAIVGDRIARINLKAGSTTYIYKANDSRVESLVYVGAEKSVALLTRESGVIVINSMGDVVAKMPHPPGKQIERIAAHPTLSNLAIVLRSESGELQEGWIVDAKSLKTIKDLEQQLTGHIGFSPDGSELISWQQYGVSKIRVSDWKASWTQLKGDGGQRFGGITSVFVGDSAQGLFVGDGAGRICHLRPGSDQVTTFEQVHNFDINSLAYVGGRLVSTDSGPDSKIVVWDIDEGKKLVVRPAIRDGYPALFAKHAGDSRFLVGYGDGLLQVWVIK